MEELNEEDMKREGGACKGDLKWKSGYIHVITKGKPGWYFIDKSLPSVYAVDYYRITNERRRISRH